MGKASRKGWIDSQCRCGGIAEGCNCVIHALLPYRRHLACTVKTFSKTNKQIYIHRGSILRFILRNPGLTLVSLCLEVNISRAYTYKRGQVTSI
ncbi:hypothetical protein VN97_g11368 [Penicillium thymicola]|uniref:Uncharacterized protein n=1 Tax=Penicillium thymicola TaxID=293382 RepID=A0AAI9T8B1_PENTH|nr:hypothetical protein VN97_g11368 [Penicillium thymicola]